MPHTSKRGHTLFKKLAESAPQSLILLFLLLSLTGCLVDIPSQAAAETNNQFHSPPEDDTIAPVVAETTGPVPFAVLYTESDITGAMYEPAEGAYLGAWLRPDMTKPAFEELVGKKHAVFVLEMQIGDDFPATWILQSISAQAAPLITLSLPYDNDFPLAELAEFAYELGNFNLPSFIVLNPLSPESVVTPEEYVLLFRYARIIFRTYAPMAAFVWHGYDNQATAESPFYPGHDVVDWVSIELLAPQGPEGFFVDIPAQLKPFYLSFQQHKPIILLPLGIGHFSRKDYVYRVPQAAAEIARIYETMRDMFPRVRLIIYGNHHLTTPKGDDFSLTREELLINAYQEATSDEHFISRLGPGRVEGPMWMRSGLHGYYYEGNIFIDREILAKAGQRNLPNVTVEINNRPYVNTEEINWLKIGTDHTRRIIYIVLQP